MATKPLDLEAFVRAYLEAILFAENDESTPAGGQPLDANYTVADFAPDALAKARRDCDRFLAENADDIAAANYNHARYSDEEMAGHDFWLTRNGHGAGFWDGELGDVGDRLTTAAHAFGECHAYVGDDGKIYLD